MVLALHASGAADDVNVKFGAKRVSALHIAAAHGTDAVVRALMFAGADPNSLSRKKNTPLHFAADAGHPVILSDLLMTGACSNAKNQRQRTPLHLAAKGRVPCVSKLLLRGADKDSRDASGKTPLRVAAQHGQLGVVEKLLAAQANINVRADDHRSPLDIAASLGRLDVLRALLRHGGDSKACNAAGYTALHFVAYMEGHDNGGSVRVLMDSGADIEAKSACSSGHAPLHLAVQHRNLSSDAVKALLKEGSNVNVRGTAGDTPLHLACLSSNVGGVELLLRWGADETLVDNAGDTAADNVGGWDGQGGSDDEEQRKADDQRILDMLARAPADRSWRRRGWLVLARSRADKMELVEDSGSTNGSSAKVAKTRCDGRGAGEGGGGQAMIDLGSLVGRVVGLEAEGVFRLVVGFL